MAFLPRALARSRWAAPLIPISWLYGLAAERRRARLSARGVRLPVPVVSVGNITCGGTGKTPAVEMIVRDLLARGRHPAILSRGYRAGADGTNDEGRVLSRALPEIPHLVVPDRAGGGRAAITAGADVLVLDDGFQHVRLSRDLDLVLIDALDPFGGGRVLPAGLLREPLRAHSRTIAIGWSPAALGVLRGIRGPIEHRASSDSRSLRPHAGGRRGRRPGASGGVRRERKRAPRRAGGTRAGGVSRRAFLDHPYRPEELAES
jgi:hypothetical protein